MLFQFERCQWLAACPPANLPTQPQAAYPELLNIGAATHLRSLGVSNAPTRGKQPISSYNIDTHPICRKQRYLSEYVLEILIDRVHKNLRILSSKIMGPRILCSENPKPATYWSKNTSATEPLAGSS